ncbi:phosphoesterase family-domain-containing protein [Chlamydoabsidia padenii]|nr:phosphoesterase family-domain-containing protein [Chlamydoabsidia padenii]
MKWSINTFITLTGLMLSCINAIPVETPSSNEFVPGNHFDRVVIVVLANANYDDAIKDSYLSTLAEKHNGLTLTNHKALTHPSQANYVGMISGSTSGIHLDFNSNIDDRKSVVDLLEEKKISWKAYQEGYPTDGKCHTDSAIGLYRRKHNPFMSFTNISGNPTRCSKIATASQLDQDIRDNNVPQFVFYTPNMKNNGRDTDLKTASHWLSSFLEPRLKQDAFSKNTLFVITWDEQETVVSLHNHVMTVLLGSMVRRSSLTDGVPYDHYSILKTIQNNWDLPSLGQNDDNATPFILKDLAENGASEKVKNVVVLMFENRSYDRLMGWFKYNKELDGLTGNECNYLDPNDKNSLKICATNNGLLKDPLDPGHELVDVTQQISGIGNLSSNALTFANTNMNGFVANFAKQFPDIKNNATALHQIMDGFNPASIPITYELASNYTVFDRWFSSGPTSTMPNRMYLHAATSHGEVFTDGLKYIPGYPQRTIYNNLDDANIDWKNYYQEIPTLLLFDQLRLGSLSHYKNWATLKKDAATGNLPPLSFIDPAYFSIANCIVENDAHPPSDVADAEKLLKEVYEMIRASPQWNETLLIVTFDEHGGYHDHVKTPLNAPNPDGIKYKDFNFDRLGVRVPAILISPWVEKGAVIHEPNGPYKDSQYEHSSVPATLKKLFNLPNFLTKRDAWAGTFENAISLDKPRTDCPVKLSDPPAPVVNSNITNPIGKKRKTNDTIMVDNLLISLCF